MITIKGVVIGGPQVTKKYESLAGAMLEELRSTVKKLGFDLELLVKSKLSGPVLKVGNRDDDTHKGELRNSINTQVVESGSSIMAFVGTSASRVPYARIHEYGGTIAAKAAPYLVFKTADGAWHRVKSVTMPERSYLRSSLADKAPTIQTEIRAALKRAAQKAGF